MEKLNQKRQALEKTVNATGRKMKVLDDFQRRFTSVSVLVMQHGFGVPADSLPNS